MNGMRVTPAEALAAIGTIAVFVVAFFAPWDPAARGGTGAAVAGLIAVATAMAFGTKSRTPLVGGALLGVLLDTAYISGCAVAYELNWWGISWRTFGDSGSGFFDAAFTVVFFAAPAAALGTALSALGSIAGHRWRASRRPSDGH